MWSITAAVVLLLVPGVPATGSSNNGVWGQWSDWSSCSVTCGTGVKTRSRTCVAALGSTPTCVTGRTETNQTECTIAPTPIDGGWGPWSEWTPCDYASGCCEQSRCRECNNPVPAYGGQACFGARCQTRNLDENSGSGNGVGFGYLPLIFPILQGWGQQKPEPVDGKWGGWGHWSACSVTEGNGFRTRQRSCNDPAPANGGEGCCDTEEGSVQVETCTVVPPPVDGQWGAWGNWSACSQTCGANATRSRSRACDSPAPSCGGRNCEGNAVETQNCSLSSCPVNGGWSEWGPWGSCSTSCGDDGTRSRSRQCNNPTPAYGGSNCTGGDSETEFCPNNPACPNDGKGRCRYDGNLGKPHMFNHRNNRLNIALPCEFVYLSVRILTPTNQASYDSVYVKVVAANWALHIDGRYFVYSLRIYLDYYLGGSLVGTEIFNVATPALNALFANTAAPVGPGTGWTKTSTLTFPSAAAYGYNRQATGNGDNTAYFSIAGRSSNQSFALSFVPVNASQPAIRNDEKPGISSTVLIADAVNVAGDRFFNTMCSWVNETKTLVSFNDDGPDIQNTEFLGQYAALVQQSQLGLPGADSLCLGVFQDFDTCSRQTEAMDSCNHILGEDVNVRCTNSTALSLFQSCLKYVCTESSSDCLVLKSADNSCNSIVKSPLRINC